MAPRIFRQCRQGINHVGANGRGPECGLGPSRVQRAPREGAAAGFPRPAQHPTRVTHLVRVCGVVIHDLLSPSFSMGCGGGSKLGDASGEPFWQDASPGRYGARGFESLCVSVGISIGYGCGGPAWGCAGVRQPPAREAGRRNQAKIRRLAAGDAGIIPETGRFGCCTRDAEQRQVRIRTKADSLLSIVYNEWGRVRSVSD